MRALRRVWVIAVVLLMSLGWSCFAGAQEPDQAVAERVLGSQWKQLSRRAGMIFAGAVLTVATPAAHPLAVTTSKSISSSRAASSATPVVELSFRVDQAIAGVELGQVLTIHEWVGAWSMHRPIQSGQHILIFLYTPSRLGLTSPVGGTLGEIVLDTSGKYVSDRQETGGLGFRDGPTAQPLEFLNDPRASVVQLARAIRNAREE